MGALHDHPDIEVLEIDFAGPGPVRLPRKIDVAFYLIHSITATTTFENIVNEENLSGHLQSRLHVEQTLRSGQKPVTVLRAAIVVGSGSASSPCPRSALIKIPRCA
jgi:hypothetical protein